MERLHRIFSNGNLKLKAFLDAERIAHEYEESIVGKTIFLLISESHPKWEVLARWLAAHDVFHSVGLEFSSSEIRAARWCSLLASQVGYPQPEDDFGYRNVTYDSRSGCPKCGIGFRQVAPFRLRKPPGRRGLRLFQLNWVFDEFFVTEECRHNLEAGHISGIDYYPVVHHKTGTTIAGWFQARINETLELSIDTSGLVTEMCEVCSGTKFNYPRGQPFMFATSTPEMTADIVKSREWFGSGGRAHRLVMVSQRCASLMLLNRWRGAHLEPVF